MGGSLREYLNSIKKFFFRNQLSNNDKYGCCEQTDVEVLLVHFCRSHSLRTWAIVGSLEALKQCCLNLKEVNIQLASLVRVLISDSGNYLTTTSSQNVLRPRLLATNSVGPSFSTFSANSSTVDMLELDKQIRSTNTSLYNSKERL